MANLVIILGLLSGADLIALAGGASPVLAGRIGLGAVFLFTALGHFIRTAAMMEMLPPAIPGRIWIIRLSGVLELVLALGLFLPSCSHSAGLAICVFLVLVAPANVYAAARRVPFGGHSSGPAYLFLRLPLQALLLGWTWWFTLR